MIRDDDADADLDFYPCLVDRAPASIYLDLRYEETAPLAGADTRYEITLTIDEPGPHGIGGAEDGERLNAIEEGIIARGRELGLAYVGRMRHRGTWEITLYGPAGHVDALRAAAPAAVVRSEPDPEWTYYRELLLPDAERKRWMDDRRMVQVLREQGDVLTTPRRVDHQAAFASEDTRDAFVAAAAREGFTLAGTPHDVNSERPFGAHVTRDDAIELDHIHDVVMKLVDAATEHHGVYRGWTAAIERS